MKSPKISIIMPAFNAAGFFERSIGCVLNQSLVEWELIIIDDASTDDTFDVAKGYASFEPRIKVLKQDTNGGPSVARNRGLQAAKGEWVAVLDADDAMDADRLERLHTAAVNGSFDIVGDNQYLYDVDAKRVVRTLLPTSGDAVIPWTLEYFVKGDLPSTGSYLGWMKPLIRLDVLKRLQLGYRPEYRYGEDFLLYSELLASGAKGAILRQPGYIYTTRVGELSRRASTQTRTTASAEQLVSASLWFEDHYKSAISTEAGRALAFRREQNRLAPVFADFKSKLGTSVRDAWSLLLSNPGLWWFIVRVSRRLPRTLLNRLAYHYEMSSRDQRHA